MKKWAYITGAFLIVVVVATSSSAVAAQVKSLVGQKVTGEYTVVVNKKVLSDKGAIIDSEANVPVRAIAKSLGANVEVSGKTIIVTSDDTTSWLSTNTDSFAAQVKSLVGQKVTGEYTVVVNGKTLQDKGSVIDNKANVPVRGISEALGADIKVEGKTITVTTDAVKDDPTTSTESKDSANKYVGQPKESLENNRNSLINKILEPSKKEREKLLREIEVLKSAGAKESLQATEDQLKRYDEDIAKYDAELQQVEAALALLD